MQTHVGIVLGPCTKIERLCFGRGGGHVGDTGPYPEVFKKLDMQKAGRRLLPIVLFDSIFGVRFNWSAVFCDDMCNGLTPIASFSTAIVTPGI